MGFNTYDAVPAWANFLTLEEFSAFLDTVANELRSRGIFFQDNNGVLEIVHPNGRFASCGLANIALKCGSVGKDEYAREVALHFDRILGKPGPPQPFPTSFDELRPYVRVRIYNDDAEHLRAHRDQIIARPLADGLLSAAVYDMEGVIVFVSPKHLERWKISPDEVFRAGIANVGREKAVREAFRLGDAELFCLASEHGFASSQVLHLGSYLSPSQYGALVAMPNRHLLICYPIRLSNVIRTLRELVPFVSGMYDDPPDGDEHHKLTTNLYWWRKGSLACIRAGMNMNGLPGAVLVPPQAFIDTVLAKAAQPNA